MDKPRKTATFLVVAVLVVIVAYWGYTTYVSRSVFAGTPMSGAVDDFALTAQDGRTVRLSDFRDKVVLVFFGYTNCPDVCPSTLTKLHRAVGMLGALADHVQVLFITVDPRRDTPAVLADYVGRFDPSFLGLTGTQAQVAQAISRVGVFYEDVPVAGRDGGRLVNHTASVFLLSPKGEKYLRYSQANLDPELLARDIRLVLRRF